jgi:hypothetical protein
MDESGALERNPLEILSRLRGNIEAFEQYLAGKIDIDEYATDFGKKTANPKKKSLSKFERGNRLKEKLSRFINLVRLRSNHHPPIISCYDSHRLLRDTYFFPQENEALPSKDIANRVVNPNEFMDFFEPEERTSKDVLEQFDARLLQLERFRIWRPARGLLTGADVALVSYWLSI